MTTLDDTADGEAVVEHEDCCSLAVRLVELDLKHGRRRLQYIGNINYNMGSVDYNIDNIDYNTGDINYNAFCDFVITLSYYKSVVLIIILFVILQRELQSKLQLKL